ncbi:MAG: extracellular solute-binding protein [Candidatus Binatia bacterium]|jgi:iron(III) transport system substrate-binding protein
MSRVHKLNFALAAMAAASLTLGTGLHAQSLEELHKGALKEGGTLNFYGTLAQINAERILPVFEKRFPGVKVNHVDATADKLAARAITEARGGRVIGDVFQGSLENGLQLQQQGLLLERVLPEAKDYPDTLKSSHWIASNVIYFIGAWNTSLVKKEDEPKVFEDFADPKWKGKLIAEPRDVEILIGLAKSKYKNDEQAIALLRKIAANNPEFHKGHSELAEFLVAGQAAACFTCYSHHYPPRIKKGAPLNYFLTEGAASIDATAVFKGAPHPNTAMLFARWGASEEGQKAYAQGGRTPAHPKVQPVEKTRPEVSYFVGAEEIKEWPKYEKIWKEIFKLR